MKETGFDTTSFTELVVVVGNTTWEVMNAKKALKIEWEKITDTNIVFKGWRGKGSSQDPCRPGKHKRSRS